MSVPSKSNGVPRKYEKAGKGEIAGCGMQFAFAIMAMLFLAGIVLYFVLRAAAPQWPPAGFPGLPGGMWLSTIILVASSATLFWAHAAASSGSRQPLKIAMAATLVLGLLFLVLQAINWGELWQVVKPLLAELAPKPNTTPKLGETPVNPGLYVTMFYILTGLHAAHVLGGVIWLLTGTLAAFRGWYQPSNMHGLRALGLYWHFLDVVWLVLFTILLVTT